MWRTNITKEGKDYDLSSSTIESFHKSLYSSSFGQSSRDDSTNILVSSSRNSYNSFIIYYSPSINSFSSNSPSPSLSNFEIFLGELNYFTCIAS